MNGPESQFYKKLKNYLSNFFIQRIENALERGTPDLFFSSKINPVGRPQGFAELKYFNLPKSPRTMITIPFRPGQFPWAKNAISCGVIVILLVQTNQGVFCFRPKDIFQKYTLVEFYSHSTFFKNVNKPIVKNEQMFHLNDWFYQLK